MKEDDNLTSFWFGLAIVIFVVLMMFMLFCRHSHARPGGDFGNDAYLSEWYRTLMQPTQPGEIYTASCCGEADAFWCDDIGTERVVNQDGVYITQNFCKITDDRPDEPRRRKHREIGEKHVIPDSRMNKDANPTGHSIIFLSTGDFVYCFVSNGGV